MQVEHGSIDLVLENIGRKIACEISMTSSVDGELGNLEKCLAVGFTKVLMIVMENRRRTGTEQSARANIESKRLGEVRLLCVKVLATLSEYLDKDAPSVVQAIGGCKVKAKFSNAASDHEQPRREGIFRVLPRSVRSMKRQFWRSLKSARPFNLET